MMNICGREISESHTPYLIAEVSANHLGSLERAKKTIEIAAKCGADAVKIQSYSADTMTIDCDEKDFIVKKGLWSGYKLYDLYHEAHTPFEWHKELFELAKRLEIVLFSTPFDESAVDLLESLDAPAYKIASFELTDLPLVHYVAKKKKPIFLSTGMATEEEISEALECARSAGCNSLLLFHCISSYPASIEQLNIKSILRMKKLFGVNVGLSDHTIGNTAATVAVALGACAIEKHFTIDKAAGGPDCEFSVEPHEFQQLQESIANAWLSLGIESIVRPEAERDSLVFRRSLYFVNSLAAGTVIQPNDIRRIRPGYGISPKFYDDVIGKKVSSDVNRGQPVTWELLLD